MLQLCCLPLAFSACKQRFTNANLQVVNRELERSEEQVRRGTRETGVTPKEVESILGPPARVETAKLPLETQKKEVDVVRYYYRQDGQEIELHFFDNKLIEKVPLLDPARKAEPSSPAPTK